jgi:hypothetical protein
MVSHIEANYERGLTADVADYGTINDMRKKFTIHTPTRVIVRKDYQPFGRVYIALGDRQQKRTLAKKAAVPPGGLSPQPHALREFRTRINGRERTYPNNDRVMLAKGDLFEIVDVTAEHGDPSQWTVNFKGFVGDRRNNTGEDRGFVINTAKDLWKRYSLHKRGNVYQVVVTHQDKVLGRLLVDLSDSAREKRNPPK